VGTGPPPGRTGKGREVSAFGVGFPNFWFE
jgi:hypothetical protein